MGAIHLIFGNNDDYNIKPADLKKQLLDKIYIDEKTNMVI